MAFYKRTKFAIDAFRSFTWKAGSRSNVIQQSSSISHSLTAKSSGFSPYSAIFQRLKSSMSYSRTAKSSGFPPYSAISQRLESSISHSRTAKSSGFSPYSAISQRSKSSISHSRTAPYSAISQRLKSSILHSLTAKSSGFSPYSAISQRLKSSISGSYRCNYNQYNPFICGAKRFYHVDRYQVQHFRPRGQKRWFHDPRIVLAMVLVGSGAAITVYFGNLETVPYTKRTHFVILSRDMERKLGETQFKQMKASFKGRILPVIHPDSVRVRLIAKDIIEALQRGLVKEQSWNDSGYASPDSVGVRDKDVEDTLMALVDGKEQKNGDEEWLKGDEVLEDKWVQKSRKEGQKKGKESASSHLDGLNWEVLVVNQPDVNAFCMPGGKIVVFTGLLDHFKTDAELSTIVGHEVGHAVARHTAETITKNLWFAILQLVLYQFITTDIVNAMSTLLLRLPFSRKMEIEADYIGLLLSASAGYDPRVAPKVYEKLGKLGGESVLRDYLSTHPSGKKRAQLLAQAKVMEEALEIFKEARAGHDIKGFL